MSSTAAPALAPTIEVTSTRVARKSDRIAVIASSNTKDPDISQLTECRSADYHSPYTLKSHSGAANYPSSATSNECTGAQLNVTYEIYPITLSVEAPTVPCRPLYTTSITEPTACTTTSYTLTGANGNIKLSNNTCIKISRSATYSQRTTDPPAAPTAPVDPSTLEVTQHSESTLQNASFVQIPLH